MSNVLTAVLLTNIPVQQGHTEHRESLRKSGLVRTEQSYHNLTFYHNFTNKALSSEMKITLLKLPPYELTSRH